MRRAPAPGQLTRQQRRRIRRAEHWHRQAAENLRELGATAAEIKLLTEIAEALRERALAPAYLKET